MTSTEQTEGRPPVEGVTFSTLNEIRRLSEEIRLCDRRRKELVTRRRELIRLNGFTADFQPPDEPTAEPAIDASTSQVHEAVAEVLTEVEIAEINARARRLCRVCTPDDYDLDFGENDSNGNA